MTRILVLVSAVALTLGCENTNHRVPPLASELHETNPLPFSGQFRLELVSDSVWENCKLVLDVRTEGPNEAFSQCGTSPSFAHPPPPPGAKPVPPSPPTPVRSVLSLTEVQELRTLFRTADLFRGQFWGEDHRATDAELVTLTVTHESKVAVLVCTNNQTFDTGSRQRLLALLTSRLRPGRQGAK